MSDIDDFMKAFDAKKRRLEVDRMNAFLQQLDPDTLKKVTSAYSDKPSWSSLEQMNKDLAKKREADKQHVKNSAAEKAKRKKHIEYELDIIRGVVPTPKNYKLDPSRVKPLMKELKDLS